MLTTETNSNRNTAILQETAEAIKKHNRADQAAFLSGYEKSRSNGNSQRDFAKKENVPRSTLQHWLARKNQIDASPTVVAFFESPDGLAFLHRMVTALHYVFSFLGIAGARLIHQYLTITGLAAFAAASVGVQIKVADAMEEKIVAFGQQQLADGAKKMKPKKITICQDETFHPAI
jgi:predicted transcriptional regulator